MPRDEMTTIKISKRLRDRISAGAAEQRQSVQRFVETILDERDRHRRLAAVGEAMASADQRAFDDWRAETHLWEAAETEHGPNT
jgi:hypothetical protein